MQKKIIIAIDGYSSCGKSTIARDLARKLGYRYIDTGAMYRAVTAYMLQNHIDFNDLEAVNNALHQIDIDFDYDEITGKQITILNNFNIELEIRSPAVSDKVSEVSTIKEVREFLVNQQKRMGDRKGIVMDGRDIGTVVFPHAELKIFMTAEEDIRVTRRFEELKATGIVMSEDDVRENLKRRDYIDTHRAESPLRKAVDAIVVDNTHLTPAEQLHLVLGLAKEKIDSH